MSVFEWFEIFLRQVGDSRRALVSECGIVHCIPYTAFHEEMLSRLLDRFNEVPRYAEKNESFSLRHSRERLLQHSRSWILQRWPEHD